MKIIKKITLLWCCMISYFNLLQAQDANALIEGHPAWIMQGNVYEVNVRQYTPEGTFKAFEKSLPRLKSNGRSNIMVHAYNTHQQNRS